MVWNETTSVGCGRMNCSGTNKTPGYYVVCEYYPAGNVVGDNNAYFKANVLKQVLGEPTDTVESGVSGTGATAASTTTTPSGANGIGSSASRLHNEKWACAVLMGSIMVGTGLLS